MIFCSMQIVSKCGSYASLVIQAHQESTLDVFIRSSREFLMCDHSSAISESPRWRKSPLTIRTGRYLCAQRKMKSTSFLTCPCTPIPGSFITLLYYKIVHCKSRLHYV